MRMSDGERKRCRVLLLEDNAIDADLTREHLNLIDDIQFDIEHVGSRQPFQAAIESGERYDLVLADFDLPDFDGMAALALARARIPLTPFIFVSGVMGEENAIEALKQGATDYVLKVRMERLQFVVRRALSEARGRDELLNTGRALDASEARLRFALQAGRLGSWNLDLRTGRLEVSDICAANFGLAQPNELATEDTWLARVLPEDRARQQTSVKRALDSGEELDVEYRNAWPDGSVHWIQIRGRATYDEDGAPVRMAGISLDVTERKRAEDRQRLLLEELNHRVKNTLAMVQSIASQTLRSADSAELFATAFQARLQALAQAHDLLTRQQWQGASLQDVVALTMEPHQGTGRVRAGGPSVLLSTGVAVSLHLAFHELATNALKYGALSVEGGQVELAWTVGDRTPRTLELAWTESGGPSVARPQRRGFGSRLIERGLPHELDRDVLLDFDPAGVRCTLSIPLSSRVYLP